MNSHESWLADQLNKLDADSLRRRRRTVKPLPGGRCRVDGRELVNCTSNDYLDLACDDRLRDAAMAAINEFGVGSRASALVSGRGPWHERLEQRIAEFEETESAILFSTGYAANVGTLTALMNAEDVVFCDRLNHASLVDGCRLSGAKLRVYRHRELDRLERELKKSAGYRRRWIVTDGVFSMDGDLAPLPAICDLAEAFDAGVIVDEAHGTGVFGETGRGVCEHFGVEDRVDVRIGTLSKAIGCLGGFVAGSRDLVEFLWNTARAQIYSTALPPAICAAGVQAIEIIPFSGERREHLKQLASSLRTRLTANGYKTPENSVAPFIPVILGDADETMKAASQLEQRGFLVGAIRPPTVPRGTARLRISLTAGHREDDVDGLIAALADE